MNCVNQLDRIRSASARATASLLNELGIGVVSSPVLADCVKTLQKPMPTYAEISKAAWIANEQIVSASIKISPEMEQLSRRLLLLADATSLAVWGAPRGHAIEINEYIFHQLRNALASLEPILAAAELEGGGA